MTIMHEKFNSLVNYSINSVNEISEISEHLKFEMRKLILHNIQLGVDEKIINLMIKEEKKKLRSVLQKLLKELNSLED